MKLNNPLKECPECRALLADRLADREHAAWHKKEERIKKGIVKALEVVSCSSRKMQ